MIEFIAVTNRKGEKLVLPLNNPYESGLAVASVDGLGPVKGSVNMTEISSSDGAIFNSSRLSSRNIVLSLVAVPNYETGLTVEDIRLRTYRYFQVKQPVTLEVKTDNRHVATIGYVESNQPDIFSSEESFQISILCPDPFLYSVGDNQSNSFSFSSKSGGFEFEFENENLVNKLLQFAEIKPLERVNLDYTGDTDSGFVIRMIATGDVRDILITKPEEGVFMRVNTSNITGTQKLIAGDELIIDTRSGKKRVTLIRNAQEINALHTLSFDTTWLRLIPGDNVFAYDADEGATNLSLNLEYVPSFEGV